MNENKKYNTGNIKSPNMHKNIFISDVYKA